MTSGQEMEWVYSYNQNNHTSGSSILLYFTNKNISSQLQRAESITSFILQVWLSQ